MRRVVVTGLGAVTPLGLDAPSTWEAAVAGRSGVDFIEAFDASEFPVRIAAEVKGFEPEAVVGRRRRGGSSATSCSRSPLRARRGPMPAWRIDPARVGILVGSAIGGVMGVIAQHEVLRERGHGRVSPWFIPTVLVDSASGQIAIDLGLRGPNYAPVSACATGSHAVGEGAEMIRRGDADVVLAGGTESCMHPGDPRRLLRDARARRRGGGSDARVAPVRRDARRLRHGRGRVRPRARGARAAQARGARIYAEVLGYGTSNDAHHMAAARSGVGRRRRDDARGADALGRRARAGRLRQRPRDVDAAGRSRRDEGDQGGVRRRTRTSSPSRRRSR